MPSAGFLPEISIIAPEPYRQRAGVITINILYIRPLFFLAKNKHVQTKFDQKEFG